VGIGHIRPQQRGTVTNRCHQKGGRKCKQSYHNRSSSSFRRGKYWTNGIATEFHTARLRLPKKRSVGNHRSAERRQRNRAHPVAGERDGSHLIGRRPRRRLTRPPWFGSDAPA
jgi:hypothetical protein